MTHIRIISAAILTGGGTAPKGAVYAVPEEVSQKDARELVRAGRAVPCAPPIPDTQRTMTTASAAALVGLKRGQ